MKIILKFVLIVVLVNIIGHYLFPYLCYLTGGEPEQLCFCAAIIVAICGLGLLIYSIIRKKSAIKNALWIILTAGAILSCYFVTIRWLASEYRGKYILLHNKRNDYGLADKYGREFIEPKYNWLVRAFDNNEKSYIFIGIEGHKVSGKEYNEFVLSLHDENGNIQDVMEVKEGDCNFIDDYINKHIGKIADTYRSWYYNVYDENRKMLNTGRTGLTQSEEPVHSKNTDRVPVNITTSESESYKLREPERHETSVPVQEWKQCWNCLGSGQCPYCYGQGHSINVYGNDVDCAVCTDGRCSICAGQGGHYEIEYKKKIEYY